MAGERLNGEVIIGLLHNSMRLEESISQNLLKLFMTEDDMNRRKILYEFIRDTHYHKSLITECLRFLGSDPPRESREDRFSDVFDDMFTLQKMAILRDILTTMRDFYSFFLEDIEQRGLAESVDESVAHRLKATVATLYGEKRRQVEVAESLGEVY